MKRVLSLAVIAAAALSAPAFAADLYVPPVEQFEPELVTWSTCYVGLPISYTTGDTPSEFPLSDYSSPLDGFPIGIQAGCDVKFDESSPLLVGIVVDVFANGPSGISPAFPVAPGITATSESNIPLFGTLRARAGITADSTLFYLTAGLAVASVENTVATSTFPGGETVSNTHVGWVAGGGIEHKFDDNWSVFGEYAYYDLGQQSYTYAPPLTVGTLDLSPTFHQVKVGINYRF